MKRLILTAALAGFAIQPVLAHRFWIIPSTSVLSGEKPWVCFDAAVSNDLFFPNHFAPAVEDFTVTGPEGGTAEKHNGCVGKYRTTFDVQLEKTGTYRVATVRSLLFARWQEDGETQSWRGSHERVDEVKDKPDVQLMDSRSRVECFVTSGEPTTPKPSGEGLELVFGSTHPNDLYAGETATFTLHNGGKPAAGVEITVIKGNDRFRNEDGEITVTTAEDGTFSFEWPEAGRYWLYAAVEGKGPEVAGMPTKGRSVYTATFEVLPQ